MDGLSSAGRSELPAAVVASLVAFVERTSDLVGVADDAGRIIYLNEAARKRMGLPAGDPVGLTTLDVFPEAAFGLYFEEIRPAILRHGTWSGLVPVALGDDEPAEVWMTIVGEGRPGGEVAWLVTSGRDVTDWRRVGEELRWRASHDELTGLARRMLLADRLEVALARARRSGGAVAAVFVDVDDLKLVNDAFGHRAGDDVLVEIARRMSRAVRGADTVARVGGDEFVVVFDGVSGAPEAEALASRVKEAVTEKAVAADGHRVRVAISLGVAVGGGEADGDDLLRRADAAMYESKRGHGAPQPPAVHRAGTTAHQVAAALTRRQIVPQYQPVAELATGATVGFQALARWGQRPTSQFIEAVEGSGIGVSLDYAILRRAVHDAATPTGSHWRMYVHVGGRFLAEAGLEWDLRELLERAGLDPSRLALEIPEHVLVRRPSGLLDAIRGLKEEGLLLVVSHFERYSTELVDLAEGLFDELRLERSMVADMERDPIRARAVAGAISLAHGIGLSAFAVGVEHAGQWSRLREMGCDVALGSLIGDPQPSPALALS